MVYVLHSERANPLRSMNTLYIYIYTRKPISIHIYILSYNIYVYARFHYTRPRQVPGTLECTSEISRTIERKIFRIYVCRIRISISNARVYCWNQKITSNEIIIVWHNFIIVHCHYYRAHCGHICISGAMPVPCY